MATVVTAKRINLAQLTHEMGVEGVSVAGALGESPGVKELTVEDVDEATLAAAVEAHVPNRRWRHPDHRWTEAALAQKARAVAAGEETFTVAQIHALLASSSLEVVDLRTKTAVTASDLEAVKAHVFGTPPVVTSPNLAPDPALFSNPILVPERL
jgi:hypothetical protein